MFHRILVVCVGNICRSPTAEYVFRHKLASQDVQVASAGLAALVGRGADSTALAVLADHGIDASAHVARQMNDELAAWPDLILAMEQRHVERITALWPHTTGRTTLLGKWLDNRDVSDPYRQQRPAFEHAYRVIAKSVDRWTPYM